MQSLPSEVVPETGLRVPLLDIGDGRMLRLVPAYKHLGGMVSGSGALGEEVAWRCSSGRVATAALRRRLLAQRSIDEGARSMGAQACVHSRLVYLTGT